MDHQQQQQNKRRAVDAGGGGQNHPLPQPCPRCNSANTKFCYYNNYSLSQPRFFCKGCRRYWTQGGTLRNVPVGGGCSKSKRPKLTSTSPASCSSPGTGTSGHGQTPSIISPTQLLRPPLSMMVAPNTINSNSNNNNNNASAINSSGGTMMMGHSFYGGAGNSGFLSSLAAIQGVNPTQNQPLSFGPNLGLLHGFGLPSFEHHQLVQQQQHNQEVSLPSLYSTREVGSSSTPSMQEWNLRVGPVLADTNNQNQNQNRNQESNENSQSNQQWSNFMGTSGLDDP